MTVIEILIVIAIITLLLQLAIPAVEMSRESAHRATCQNNLRQLGFAGQLHASTNGRYPSGGWGFAWAGDANRGNDKRQPGGWIYNVLPFLEEQALHDLGKSPNTSEKEIGIARMCQTPLSLLYCPSRRIARLYPYDDFVKWPMRNTAFLGEVAKTDYAANAGDHFSHGYPGPKDLVEGDSPDYPWDDPQKPACEPSKSTGPVYLRSEIRPAQIVDGTSKTYLAGEKYLNPVHYKDGTDKGDDQVAYNGFDADTVRFVIAAKGLARGVIVTPKRDVRGDDSLYLFGSAHPDTCNFVYCDGSVHSISYLVDPEVHRALGNRQDDLLTTSQPPL